MAHKAGRAGSVPGAVVGEDSDALARRIDGVELSPTVERHVERYERVAGVRSRLDWKRIQSMLETFTLSTVAADRFETVRDLKLSLTILVTTLDDLAEGDADPATFEAAKRIPDRASTPTNDWDDAVDGDVVAFLESLWTELQERLADAPRFGEFEAAFAYDVRQTVGAMEYSRLVNEDPAMVNRAEVERFDAYNMSIFPFACVDLMHSPSFDRAEFGALRSLLCELQQLTRIGNWLATWERELREGDPSSAIVACAIRRGVVEPDEIGSADGTTAAELANRIHSNGIEREFFREWEIRHRAVRKRTGSLESVDGSAIVDAVESVTTQQLAAADFR